MQQPAWGLTVVLLAVLNVHFIQAATIGTSSTGSVAVLTASAEVSYRVGTGGSCGFGPIGDPYPDSAVLSIRSTSAVVAKLPESGCGACIQLTCTDQGACSANSTPVVVTVVDSCSSCSTAIPAATFNRLAPTYLGNIAVQMQQVDCTPPGNIVIRVLEYRPTSGGYIKITPLDTAGVATVSSINTKASSADASMYQPLKNTYGAVWEASGLPAPPLDFQLTDSAGHTVVAMGLAFQAAGDLPTSVQFPPTAAAPVSPSPVAVPVLPSPSPIIPSPSPPTIPPPVPVLPSPSPSPVVSPAPVLPPPVVPSPAPVLPPPTPVLPPPAPVVPPPVPVPPLPSPAVAPAAAVPTVIPPLAPVPVAAPVAPTVSPMPLLPVAPVQPALAPPPVVAVPPAVAVPPVAAVPPVVPPVILPPVPAPRPAPFPAAAPAPVVVSPPFAPPVPVVSPVPSSPAFPPAPVGPCQNVLQILQSNPSLSTWLSTLQDLGQASSLGNDRLNITMFAPLNSAFNAPLPAGSTLGSGTVAQLLQSHPELKSPIAGYHVVAGAYPTSSLTPGTSLPTVDVERTPGQQDRPVLLNVTAPLTLQGVGSSAYIVQPDLKTCGPSIVQVIDGVLLPFSPSTGPAAGG
ncbi:probable Expansin-B17 at N-terminal half [Coccomyxa sp. Obi]|nr:probable Expansin-B17 at N-terminal half [Coccomyxa sp. Obi]